jgi:hypothetical protein
MCVVLSATVTLCCLFMPKMYIVLFHPEKYARAAQGSKQPVKATPSAGVSGLCQTLIQVQSKRIHFNLPKLDFSNLSLL